MASTTFTDGVTPIVSNWLNDVDNATYRGGATFIQSGTGAVPRTMQDKGREWFTLADFATTAQAITAASSGRLMVDVGQSVTLNVPATFATIQAAFTAIADWVILGTVTIQVANSTYTLASSVSLNHPYGSNIRLLGNTSTPDNCIVRGTNPPTFDAFVCSNGNKFGLLDGFMIDLSVKATQSNNYTAVLATNGAQINCGAHIKTNNWYYGVAARNGSFINCPSANVNNAGDVGIWAFVGSTIYAQGATSTNASDVANGLGFGFQAEYGSALDCSSGTASGCNIGGIASLSNSSVRALSATSNNNTGSGFFASGSGAIEAHNATASSNTRYGVEETGGARILGNSMTLTGNTIADIKPTAYFDNSTLGARIAATGDFRIDLNSTGNFYFNSSGGLQFNIAHTASAINRWLATGSATGQPLKLSANGSDADIPANLEAKGNAGARLVSNSNIAFQAYNSSSSAINYGQCNGSTTTNPVLYTAFGADTNIGLLVRSKGTGSTRIASDNGDLLVITDPATGAQANHVEIISAAATSAPRILATGSDTNVDLNIVPKGTGVVRFGTFTSGSDTVSNGYITIKDSGGTVRKVMVTA